MAGKLFAMDAQMEDQPFIPILIRCWRNPSGSWNWCYMVCPLFLFILAEESNHILYPRSPSSALLPFFGGGSPAKIDYREENKWGKQKKGYQLILTSLEDLVHTPASGNRRRFCWSGSGDERWGLPFSQLKLKVLRAGHERLPSAAHRIAHLFWM